MAITRPTLRLRSMLCPVDFSGHSRDALQYARMLAQRFRGRVTVLFVNDPFLLAAVREAYGDRRAFIEQSRSELSRFVKQVVPQRSALITSVVAVGSPDSEILAAAKRLRSDLVVIGTQGLSGVKRLFFGSTTEQVLRHATVPVLAIPPTKNRRRASLRRQTVDQVIVPIDLAGEWQSDAVRGADIARMFGVPLRLVHVLRPVQTLGWLLHPGAPTELRRIEKAAQALERVTQQLGARMRVSCSVVLGEPGHEIARLTRRGSALVVMSLRGTRGVWGHRGAIAYHVLTRASTPVLAMPRRRLGGPLSTRLSRAIGETLTARDRIEIAGIDALLSVGSRGTRLKR